MIVKFCNDSWFYCKEKEYFKRILKSLRYHDPSDGLNKSTTQIVFLSSFNDRSIRHYFEDSSKDFKTYNSFVELCEIFFIIDSVKPNTFVFRFFRTPDFVYDMLESAISYSFLGACLKFLLGQDLLMFFKYRQSLKSISKEDLSHIVLSFFTAIGLIDISELIVIVSSSSDRNREYALKFLCNACNDMEIRRNLSQRGFLLSSDVLVVAGFYDQLKNKFSCCVNKTISRNQKKLLTHFGSKTELVLTRIHCWFNSQSDEVGSILIIGRRFLTRGLTVINKKAFLQSYDFNIDAELFHLKKILKLSLGKFFETGQEILVIIEHHPNKISYMISQDDEIKSIFHSNQIALACIEPGTKNIYSFESNQFVLQCLKQVY